MPFYLFNLCILLFLLPPFIQGEEEIPISLPIPTNSTDYSSSSPLLQPPQCPRIPLSCSTRDTVEEHSLLTRQLFHRLNLWKTGSSPRPILSKHSPNHSFALLEMGKDIVKAGCPSHFISPGTLDMALYIFILLHGMHKERYEEPISTQSYDRIAPILAACENSFKTRNNQENKFFFDMDSEDEEAVNCMESGFVTPIHQTCRSISSDLSSCSPITPRKNRFCPENNLILEIVWNIVDFVNAACLTHFQDVGATSGYHLWEQAQENLFTRRIRKYWYESRLTSHEYQTILGENVMMDAYNLEMCVEGVYSSRSSFPQRLNRPPYKFRIYRRRRRSLTNGLMHCP
ncbi:unnamed protein product [Orchesella dallaii]|uniref:Uncharacterized protein n=1 Tax=Orchesella dallaii TaxID=48710 RepID=A0ABP1RY62_9HEXA